MKSHDNSNNGIISVRKGFFYGWIVVAAATIILTINFGIQYSFGIFFKPLVTDFGWSRGTTSVIQSLYLVCYAFTALTSGWLVEKFGTTRVLATGNFIAGLGLVLTSQAGTLWQFYITYSMMVGLGLGSNFSTVMSTVARWFLVRRGLALGVVACGAGLSNVIIVPLIERLIVVFGWSGTYIIMGFAAWIIMIGCAIFLKRDPQQMGLTAYGMEASSLDSSSEMTTQVKPDNINHRKFILTAMKTRVFWLIAAIFFLTSFCLQLIMVHLVNYATDIGSVTLAAVTLISIIGLFSIAGRLSMGVAADRIGTNNVLIFCSLILSISLFWLVFSNQMWMLFIFAVVFGLAYGGEVPQITLINFKAFGIRGASIIVGITSSLNVLGGAFGAWTAGFLFDLMHSYQLAFIFVAVFGLLTVIFSLMLKNEMVKRKSGVSY
jgi:MFS transporter, OFA family, oxalate/formate antiporter